MGNVLRRERALRVGVVHHPRHAIADEAPAHTEYAGVLHALRRVLLRNRVLECLGFDDGLRLAARAQLVSFANAGSLRP